MYVAGTPIASSAWMRSSPTKKDHLTASVLFRGLSHNENCWETPINIHQPYHHHSHQLDTLTITLHPSYNFFVEKSPGLPDCVDLTFRAIARQQGFREETRETIQSLATRGIDGGWR